MSYQKQKKTLGKLRKMLFILPKGSFCCRDIYLFLACPLASSVPLPNLQKQTEGNVLMSAILLPLLVFP